MACLYQLLRLRDLGAMRWTSKDLIQWILLLGTTDIDSSSQSSAWEAMLSHLISEVKGKEGIRRSSSLSFSENKADNFFKRGLSWKFLLNWCCMTPWYLREMAGTRVEDLNGVLSIRSFDPFNLGIFSASTSVEEANELFWTQIHKSWTKEIYKMKFWPSNKSQTVKVHRRPKTKLETFHCSIIEKNE